MLSQQDPLAIQDTDTIEFTILMPCLNEAETIGTCVHKASQYIARSGVRAEILVADNGSTDGSQSIATAKGARVVAATERGYGAALRAGILAAQGRYVIMGDADDSYDFSRLDDIVASLRQGNDLVMGNRFRGGIDPGAMPVLHRFLGNPVLSIIGRTFFHVKIGDFHCGLRGFDRVRLIALNLHTTGMEFASEMVIQAALRKYRIAEVPVALKKDGRSRPPPLRTWHDGCRHLRFLLIFSPRWLFFYPGVALIGLGLLGAILLFPGPMMIADGVAIDLHTFIVAAIAILVGLQIISFGLIAQRFATAKGFLPESKHFAGILSAVTLERGLILAVLVTAIGFGGLVWALFKWASVEFGPLTYPLVMRVLVLSLIGIAGGIPLAFTSFLLGIMDLPLHQERMDAK